MFLGQHRTSEVTRGKCFLCIWIAFQLRISFRYTETKQIAEIHQSCSFWGLHSKVPERSRTGPEINSSFIGHQFKVTQSDSVSCGDRSRGPCNEIHAASPYLKPTLAAWIHLSLSHSFTCTLKSAGFKTTSLFFLWKCSLVLLSVHNCGRKML